MKVAVTTDPADQDYSFTLTMPDPFDIKVQDYRWDVNLHYRIQLEFDCDVVYVPVGTFYRVPTIPYRNSSP